MSDLPEKEAPATQEAPLKETSETEIPKEVASAGVTIQPTTIPIPPPVANMGVTPGPANIPMPVSGTALPITDDQIASGLGKSIQESWRWLAEWCLRRLRQMHVGLQSIHGRLVRVKA